MRPPAPARLAGLSSAFYGGTSQPASSTQVTGFARVPPVGSKSFTRTHALALGPKGEICREQIVRVALYPVEPLGSLP